MRCGGLATAFALAGTHEQAMAIRDDVGFFQAVRAALVKLDPKTESGETKWTASRVDLP